MADFIEIDTSELTTFLKVNLGENLPEAYNTREVVGKVGEIVRARIVERTREGVDINLQPFMPYGFIHAFVRNLGGLPTSHVDLWFTGDMLSNIKVQVESDTEATVGFTSDKERKKAKKHQRGERSIYSRKGIRQMLRRVGYSGPLPWFVRTRMIKVPQRVFFGISGADREPLEKISKVHEEELDNALKKV